MASLKCSHCGFGIHYHDEPNGVEYTALSQEHGDVPNADVSIPLKHIDQFSNRHIYLVMMLLFILSQKNTLFLLISSLKMFLKEG